MNKQDKKQKDENNDINGEANKTEGKVCNNTKTQDLKKDKAISPDLQP